ncbi:MAG: AbrB/MazE/SpoVT family DNA-binding domain-containing protein [Alphaproteobacteria bacterium]|nr:AbrB/MazE/SpoVT family DNA-binding domain-containing protein [Alphaproteobacteria bacterium]
MAIATITSKGQTTIPKDVRDRLRLKAGDRVEFLLQEDGTALMVPTTITLAELQASVPRPRAKLDLAEIEATIRRRSAKRARRA